MKKIILLFLCVFSVGILIVCKLNCKENNTCKLCTPRLTNYYFSLDQMIIQKDQIYINFKDRVIPIYNISKDKNGYFAKINEDAVWCPGCNGFTFDAYRNCCYTPGCEFACAEVSLDQESGFD